LETVRGKKKSNGQPRRVRRKESSQRIPQIGRSVGTLQGADLQTVHYPQVAFLALDRNFLGFRTMWDAQDVS